MQKEPPKLKRPVKVKIADKTYNLWATSEAEESFMREAAKIVDAQVLNRMKQEKGEVDMQKILSMVCLDAMVARLKGDNDLDIIQSEVFQKLDYLQQHFGVSNKN
jgi:cell division protein ZapA